MSTIDRLRALLAKASLPPWEHRQGAAAFKGWPVASFGEADDGDGHWVSIIGRGASEGPTRGADNDARLVAAMRNALPALLDVAEAAQAVLDARDSGASFRLVVAMIALEDSHG